MNNLRVQSHLESTYKALHDLTPAFLSSRLPFPPQPTTYISLAHGVLGDTAKNCSSCPLHLEAPSILFAFSSQFFLETDSGRESPIKEVYWWLVLGIPPLKEWGKQDWQGESWTMMQMHQVSADPTGSSAYGMTFRIVPNWGKGMGFCTSIS